MPKRKRRQRGDDDEPVPVPEPEIDQIPVCPEHGDRLVCHTTRVGKRWACPVVGCEIAWWGRPEATPANNADRRARRDVAELITRLNTRGPSEQLEIVEAYFRDQRLTIGTLNAGHRVELERLLFVARQRATLIERLQATTEDVRIQWIHWMSERARTIENLHDPVELGESIDALGRFELQARREVERLREEAFARQSAGRTRRAKPPEMKIQPVRTKRRMNLD